MIDSHGCQQGGYASCEHFLGHISGTGELVRDPAGLYRTGHGRKHEMVIAVLVEIAHFFRDLRQYQLAFSIFALLDHFGQIEAYPYLRGRQTQWYTMRAEEHMQPAGVALVLESAA